MQPTADWPGVYLISMLSSADFYLPYAHPFPDLEKSGPQISACGIGGFIWYWWFYKVLIQATH